MLEPFGVDSIRRGFISERLELVVYLNWLNRVSLALPHNHFWTYTNIIDDIFAIVYKFLTEKMYNLRIKDTLSVNSEKLDLSTTKNITSKTQNMNRRTDFLDNIYMQLLIKIVYPVFQPLAYLTT